MCTEPEWIVNCELGELNVVWKGICWGEFVSLWVWVCEFEVCEFVSGWSSSGSVFRKARYVDCASLADCEWICLRCSPNWIGCGRDSSQIQFYSCSRSSWFPNLLSLSLTPYSMVQLALLPWMFISSNRLRLRLLPRCPLISHERLVFCIITMTFGRTHLTPSLAACPSSTVARGSY